MVCSSKEAWLFGFFDYEFMQLGDRFAAEELLRPLQKY